MGKVVEVPIHLPHPALADADWADAYKIEFPSAYKNARDAAVLGMANFPVVVKGLLWLRNIVVAPFGLETGSTIAADVKRVGLFPMVSETQSQLIVGMDDKHLDFRIVLDLDNDQGKQSLVLATIIKRHNWLGRAYLFCITPFHKVIVRGMLKRMAAI